MECDLCHTQRFKYQCPRCNIKYCSLDCYRSENHSQCSEAFYKECVMSELQEQNCNTNDKIKVMEMLQRIEREEQQQDEEGEGEEEGWEDLDSDDDLTQADLAERLDEVDLNNADAIWERLTDAEREEFRTIVHNGDIDNIVRSVEPFWKQKIEQLVMEVGESERRIKEIHDTCPAIMPNIKSFQQISSKAPAKCVVYNVAHIVASYSYIFRLYNGDHLNYEFEAANNFISICENLKSNANFETIDAVIDSIVLNCHNSNLHADNATKSLMHEDVKDIFDGPNDEYSKVFLLASLSDVIRLFEAVRRRWKESKPKKSQSTSKSFSSQFPSYNESTENYKELHNQTHFLGCLKKIEFYLSFSQHCYNKNDWSVEF